MSVKRSPPGTSRSLTNLSTSMGEFSMEHHVTRRKRKQQENPCCDCATELQDFRKDIFDMLQKFTNTQEATMSYMRENITEMKTQLGEIKVSIQSLNNEQISMKSQISNLTLKTSATDNKIQTLEAEITVLKNNYVASVPESRFDENIMHELQERASREKNIIMVGIPECKTPNIDEGRSYDAAEVFNIINNLIPDCPKPARIFRLGKYNPRKNRSIKVCFESSHTTKLLFRSKDKLQSGIKIYADQTPAQQHHMKKLKNELAQRTANGESDITIKYIKGLPKIVATTETKN